MLKNRLKRPPRRFRKRFWRVSKKDINIEGSWARFFIDFRWISGAPGEAKMWSIPRTLTKFWVFRCLKLSYLLEPQKHWFWLRFGGQVGTRNRPCWPQEALGTPKKLFFRPLNFHPKRRQKKERKRAQNKKTVKAGTGSALRVDKWRCVKHMKHKEKL